MSEHKGKSLSILKPKNTHLEKFALRGVLSSFCLAVCLDSNETDHVFAFEARKMSKNAVLLSMCCTSI